jgi:hypothetical protein
MQPGMMPPPPGYTPAQPPVVEALPVMDEEATLAVEVPTDNEGEQGEQQEDDGTD